MSSFLVSIDKFVRGGGIIVIERMSFIWKKK